MHLPGRHKSAIDSPVEDLDGWDGSIAYLDRDGVLIKDCHYLSSADKVQIELGVRELIKFAKAHDWIIIII